MRLKNVFVRHEKYGTLFKCNQSDYIQFKRFWIIQQEILHTLAFQLILCSRRGNKLMQGLSSTAHFSELMFAHYLYCSFVLNNFLEGTSLQIECSLNMAILIINLCHYPLVEGNRGHWASITKICNFFFSAFL